VNETALEISTEITSRLNAHTSAHTQDSPTIQHGIALKSVQTALTLLSLVRTEHACDHAQEDYMPTTQRTFVDIAAMKLLYGLTVQLGNV
jgi:hypothetical protein